MSGRDTAKQTVDDDDDDSVRVRKPYTAPKLRHLGSVRQLTLGSPEGFVGDGAGGFVRP